MFQAILLIASTTAAGVAPDPQIQLTCSGAGAANKLTGAMATLQDNRGYQASANVIGHRRDAFEDQVDVVINGDSSKIRLPRTMLPPIHGGDNGWFKLKDLSVEDGSISGSAAVNFMNSPKVHIDRRSGSISIDGKAGHYQGQCEKTDMAQPTKF